MDSELSGGGSGSVGTPVKEVVETYPGDVKGSRFDYIAYDETSQRDQLEAKKAVQGVETVIDMIMPEMTNRAKEQAIICLEQCYMWIGKGIRDQQIKANGKATIQEQRVNS